MTKYIYYNNILEIYLVLKRIYIKNKKLKLNVNIYNK